MPGTDYVVNANPGDVLAFEIWCEWLGPQGVVSYQCAVEMAIPACGTTLDFQVGLHDIDTTRSDYLYYGLSPLAAVNTVPPLAIFGGTTLIGAAPAVLPARYLGEFSYRVPMGGSGPYFITPTNNFNTYLDGPSGPIAFDRDGIRIDLPTTCAAPDVAMTALTDPYDTCNLSSTETLRVRITNNDLVQATVASVSYEISGPIPHPSVTEPVTSVLAPLGALTHHFATKADFTLPGTYTITCSVAMAGDTDLSNNTQVFTIVTSGISVFPWVMDFEMAGLGVSGSLGPDLTRSSPTALIADTVLTPTSGTGPRFDHTVGGLTGKFLYLEANIMAAAGGGESTLTTECFDLSVTNDPKVTFWYHMKGAEIGSLHLDAYHGGMWHLDLFTLVGQQHTSVTSLWTQTPEISLAAFPGTTKLRWRASYNPPVSGATYTGDIAIDDIEVYDAPTSAATRRVATATATASPTSSTHCS